MAWVKIQYTVMSLAIGPAKEIFTLSLKNKGNIVYIENLPNYEFGMAITLLS